MHEQSAVGNIGGRHSREGMTSNELALVMKNFKTKSGDRVEMARKLAPHIRKGMTQAQVFEMLGAPTEKTDDGEVWSYILFYSRAMDVWFDRDGKVVRVGPAREFGAASK